MAFDPRSPRLHRVLSLAALLALAAPALAAEAPRGTLADGRFTPGGTPAAEFTTTGGGSCGLSGVFGYLTPLLSDMAKEKGKPMPEPDGRLCAAAQSLLGWKAKGDVPPNVSAFTAQWFGVPTAPQQVLIENVEHLSDREVANEPREVAEKVFELVGGFMLNAKQARYGLALERTMKGGFRSGKPVSRVVVVMLDTQLALDAAPRRLAAGQAGTLSGTVLGDLQKPVVLVGEPSGKYSKVETPEGKAFKAPLTCGTRPGPLFVEIRATTAAGAGRLLANFKVACGTELPTSVELSGGGVKWPEAPAEQEKRAVEAINAERTAMGLPALAWDDGVASVAREVSAKLRDGDAGSVDLSAMLAKAGAMSPVVLQNPGQAVSAQAASDRFLEAPTSRANILSPEVTHVGVGVVAHTEPGGQSSVFMTQLFVKQLPKVDVEAVRQQLRAAIGEKRAAAGVPAVASDATFEEQAQKYAQELAAAGGDLPAERDEKLVASLSKGWVVKMLVGPSAQPLDYANEKKVTTVGHVMGVGVAQGNHKNLGKNAFYVVILIAEKVGPGAKPAAPAKAAPVKPAAAPAKKK